jgi:hypothetical protein
VKKSELKSIIKSVLREIRTESTEPSIGGGYSDQQTTIGGYDVTQLERDPLLDPLLTGKEMNEDNDRKETLKQSIFSSNEPWDYIYDLVKHGTITVEELKYLAGLLADPKDY